jgi:hypothetical protein
VTLRHRVATVRRLLARCARLGPADGATCLLSWVLFHIAVVQLRFAPHWPGWRPAPDRWGGGPSVPSGRPEARAARLVRLFDEALRFPVVGGWCLPRAVALRRLLRMHRLEAQLALGLRQGPQGLNGHAWVVYDGAALREDAGFLGSFSRCEVS